MKILVVEDDRKVAAHRTGLKEEGHVVDVAPDARKPHAGPCVDYDVILLDVVLPKKNGFQSPANSDAKVAPLPS